MKHDEFSRSPKRRVHTCLFMLVLSNGIAACTTEAPRDVESQETPPVSAASTTQTRFVDATATSGIDFVHVDGGSGQRYMVETMGAGGGFLDFDGDGWLDVFLVQSGPLPGFEDPSPVGDRLYRNRGDGELAFEDISVSALGGPPGYGMGACFADVDNDGDTDVYVTRFGEDRLLVNKNGRLKDITSQAGIDNPLWATSCAFADYDQDGCLDLYVVNYVDFTLATHRRCMEDGLHVYCHPDVYRGVPDVLYRNRCTGSAPTFENVSQSAGVWQGDPNEAKGLGVVWSDVDDDGDVDLYVANDSTRNFLYRNEGNGRFRDVGVASGTAFNDQGVTEAGMGTDAGDVDGDGRFDLFVAHLDFETNTLYRNQGRGFFVDATASAGLAAPSMRLVGFGVNLFDADNDTDLDLFVANGHILDNIAQQKPSLSYAQPDHLFLGDGRGHFELAGTDAGAHFDRALVSRGSAVGDLDNDGDLDLMVTTCNQAPVVLENTTSDAPSLLLRLVSRHGGRDAIGARVTLQTSSGAQTDEVRSGSSYLSQGDLRLHFGLGQEAQIEQVEVRWPEGERQTFTGSELQLGTVNILRQSDSGNVQTP